MSHFLSQLQSQLQRFDDEALAALANRGLLRRAHKDLEKLTLRISEESAAELVLSAGEHRIRFDTRGPAHAQCSCPASGICQHILAAVIALQRMTPAADASPVTEHNREQKSGEGADAAEATSDEPLAPLHAALLHITPSDMTRHGGTRAYRWALQFVHDLDAQSDPKISGSKYVVIRFAHPRVEFRYLGGGLDNLIADVNLPSREKYQIAAVLAYQRAHGAELPAPFSHDLPKTGTAALNLSKEHALPDAAGEQAAARQRLRESLQQLIEESVSLGLAHLSRGIQERFSTLAVWAQGVQYHRLALLIRGLADHVEMLLVGAGGADEHRLLDELALAYGLANALGSAATEGGAPTHLIGRARSQYAQGGPVELLGLGAWPWRSASGYVGLSIFFWSPQDGVFLCCSDARPETQRRFNPRERYRASGPWAGISAPAQLTGCRASVTGAHFNAQGRISTGQGCSASVLPPVGAAHFAATLPVCDDWSVLIAARGQRGGSLLAESQPMRDWVVLRPARYSSATFDTTRQTLNWPVFDQEDRMLDVELVYSDMAAHAIARIEQMEPDQLPPGTLLVAKLRNDRARLTAEPLSLIYPDAGIGQTVVDALHFDDPVDANEPLRARIRHPQHYPAVQDAHEVIANGAPSRVPRALRDVREWAQRQAESGLAPETGRQALARISVLDQRAEAGGMTLFSKLAPEVNPARRLLRMHYLCMQYERLLESELGDGDLGGRTR
ncbi:SWIM zinc finger family protein [Herbaspirillum huttiense F1]|uniref:SWIM zinc finger family protein n=1 Tax=Herbaspirillum huttiense subsp. lycopersici TaxID=3074428 RepID=A0ABU2EEL8_9BURK|nr:MULTISPECIES: SWIM zinc finger family protein [Herbaspirillum]MBP1313255.1 hypothetical protein [Herbaspirillum sp. 1130]MDR9846591.1 SWIM zinc finger family protein [Herbaspirillum huttiense SE1]MDT0356034.1 SWIM zinc finger family protein [Herbaspirillum huttiense F1]